MGEWFITTGRNGMLCVVPKTLLDGRKSIKTFPCDGIIEAIKELHNYESNLERKNSNSKQ